MTAGRRIILAMLIATLLGCLRHADQPFSREDDFAYGTVASPVADDSERVRFVVIGDAGHASIIQGTIARGVHRACDGDCDFIVMLGDNVYEEGIRDANDEARLACIIKRYPSEHAYLVLGNHDYDIVTPSLERARNQLSWLRRDTADGGPEAHGGYHHFRFSAGPVDIVGLDTNHLVRTPSQADYPDLSRWLGRLKRKPGRWTLAMGHHPYVSNGAHGNAGDYRDGGFELWAGTYFGWFLEREVLGRAHVYMGGRDHNL